jgi:hypothetical protein
LLALALTVLCTASGSLSASDSMAASLAQADHLLERFKYDEAISVLTDALEKPGASLPERAAVYVRIGIARFSIGDEEGATSVFKEALALDVDTALPKHTSPKISRVFEKLQNDVKLAALQNQPTTGPDPFKDQPPVVPPPPPQPNRVPTIVASSVAVALTGVGLYLGSRARQDEQSALDAQFGDTTDAFNKSAQSNATFANVMFGVAGASVAAAVVFYVAF